VFDEHARRSHKDILYAGAALHKQARFELIQVAGLPLRDCRGAGLRARADHWAFQ
jgi:hypothetical protein